VSVTGGFIPATKIETAGVVSSLVAEYEAIPIAFEVTSLLAAHRPGDRQPFVLAESPIDQPYVKDYDTISDRPGG
jgi:hypothetical protein